VLVQAARELAEYFAGRRRQFETPLEPIGTAFQRSVWAALATIPYGRTLSYAALADALGRPGAARAVGAANARNPLSLFLPCHRVLGSGGALTGYAGGLERKRWLLAHEHQTSSTGGLRPPAGERDP
jgi:methylated-DNA-[protein]-cysteine S-methyltransferase